MKQAKLNVYPNAVQGIMHNRRVRLIPTKTNNIVMEFTIMDGNTKQRGVHVLTHKDKAVMTGLMITKESAILLYNGLREVLSNFDEMVKNGNAEEPSEPTKHICPEASHIECSCKDKCLRNINNY